VNEGKARRFHRLRRRSRHLAFAARVGVLVAAALWGRPAAVIDAFLDVPALPAALQVVLGAGTLAAALALAAELAALPFVIHGDYLLERRFGLSRQSFGGWLASSVQAMGVRVAGWSTAAFGVYSAIGIWPDTWWQIAGAGYLVTMVVQATLASAAVAKRARPLRRSALQARLQALTRRARAPVIAIHEWRVASATDTANAAVVGIGPSRRILVSDTLLEDYSDEEIEVIIAHEIGHHVHWDLWQMIACTSAMALGAFWTASIVLATLLPLPGVPGLWDVGSVPLLALVYGAVMVMSAPIVNTLSRWHERRADRYALRVTGNLDAFVSGLRRVSAQYLAEERPSRLVEWLFHSHPPLAARLAGARAAVSKG
jgi:STE24 endopeptidase